MKDLFGKEIIEIHRGGGKSMCRAIGASNHALTGRVENDFYATPPEAVEMLCDMESFSHTVMEPCCGMGHIGKVLERRGHVVIARDLIDRGYGTGGMNFLLCTDRDMDVDIVTNPPYCKAQEFVEKSMDVIAEGHKVAMFLKLTFLEGKARRSMFEKYPPQKVYVSTSRLSCGRNGTDFIPSVICYAWFVWVKGWHGDPIIKWFN